MIIGNKNLNIYFTSNKGFLRINKIAILLFQKTSNVFRYQNVKIKNAS